MLDQYGGGDLEFFEESLVDWRPSVDRNHFYRAAPDGISLDVCDTRFAR